MSKRKIGRPSNPRAPSGKKRRDYDATTATGRPASTSGEVRPRRPGAPHVATQREPARPKTRRVTRPEVALMMGVSVRYIRKLAAQGKLTFVKDVNGTFNASLAHIETFMRQRRARAIQAALLRERRDARAWLERERVERAQEARPNADETDALDESPDTERSPQRGFVAAETPTRHAPELGRLRVEGGTLEALGVKRSATVVIGECAVIVGRNKRCTIVLEDQKISKLHAAFVATERGVRLRDLGSRNGTYVGSVRVWEVYLTTPASVYCGETKLRFRPAQARGPQRRSSGTSKKPSRQRSVAKDGRSTTPPSARFQGEGARK